jgi:hypothetical protein
MYNIYIYRYNTARAQIVFQDRVVPVERPVETVVVKEVECKYCKIDIYIYIYAL